MAHMQEMQPYFDKYQEKVRKAKNASGMTLAELSQCSGVPYNSICSVNAGTTKQPLLFYSAATCKVLGLSPDGLTRAGSAGRRTTATNLRINQ